MKFKRHFWLNIKINRVVQFLIYSDIAILTGWGLVNPIFSIYVLDQIEGADVGLAGLAATVFFVTKSFTQLPIARYIDKKKGELDDYYILLVGGVLGTISTFLYIFAKTPESLMLNQVLFGVSAAMMYAPWNAIFTRHIDRNREAMEWSLYDTSNDLGIALAAAIGGLLAAKYSYDLLFIIAGLASIIGNLFILGIFSGLKRNLKATKLVVAENAIK